MMLGIDDCLARYETPLQADWSEVDPQGRLTSKRRGTGLNCDPHRDRYRLFQVEFHRGFEVD